MAEVKSRPAYCWGRPEDTAFAYAALSGQGLFGRMRDYEPSRPALGEQVWSHVDRALDEARRACELRLLVALVADDAENVARWLYVWAEPGPDVIAIGHADRSVSFCITDETVDANEAPLNALLADTKYALDRDELAPALLSIASHLRSLRLPARLRGRLHPPIPAGPPRPRN
jgi:hypothetical protein